MEGQTNWLALGAGVIATQFIGFIWYHPKVFGTAWKREIGMTDEQQKQTNLFLTMFLSIIVMCAVAYALKYVAHGEARYVTFKHGAYHALMDGAMLVIPVIAITTMYEQRSLKYFGITAGYWLLNLSVIGGIISWWR
jgi:hypothetical protein